MCKKELNIIICKRITELRKKCDLTIEQLAYQSGISKGGLSEIERGMKSPMPYTVSKICAGLGITLKQFFDYDEIDYFTNNKL